GSPFDPSGSSSSSSTSPSPSISTATAASTPLTTEGISAVTKGTASATINDTRSKYGPGQPRGRGAIRGDYKELTSDRYAASLDYPDRTDTPFKDIGGLVQPAPNDAHSSSPYSRSNSQEMGSYRYESQQSPQLHPNEPNMNGSTNGTRRYSPDIGPMALPMRYLVEELKELAIRLENTIATIVGTWIRNRIYTVRNRVEDMDRYLHQAQAA
ncbi:hypothetical protein BGX31_002108, partial [Mortierella sp. GBA43]